MGYTQNKIDLETTPNNTDMKEIHAMKEILQHHLKSYPSTKNGKASQSCKVCQQLSPAQITELESDVLYPTGKCIQRKYSIMYGINFKDITAHMDNRKEHREQKDT